MKFLNETNDFIFKEFIRIFYSENDAIFDRLGNDISKQFEDFFRTSIDNIRKTERNTIIAMAEELRINAYATDDGEAYYKAITDLQDIIKKIS